VDLTRYRHGPREDTVFYVNPRDGMTVDKILRITGGRRAVIVADAHIDGPGPGG